MTKVTDEGPGEPALPFGVKVTPNEWIQLHDGTRLGARLWRPELEEPVPVVLEFLPYRKGDMLAARDHGHASYFAGHGYAYARVDLRGTGDSDGIILDEYSVQEHDDAVEVIAWLADQSWCSGSVGMMGNSWGGFNALQVAARRPPELKAIIAMHGADDRYGDDVHYYGGCMLASEMLLWSTVMLPMNALPPDPATVGDRWREMWHERLEHTPHFVDTWLAHQRRDDYWLSVVDDLESIDCAVYMVGGWADAYRNAVPRVLAGAKAPRRGLIGQWAHGFPHSTPPGPHIGFLQECLRWWARWLRDEPNGIDSEPMMMSYIQEPSLPGKMHEYRAGRWVAEPSWPTPNVSMQRLYMSGEGLLDEPGPSSNRAILGSLRHGRAAGAWCPGGDAPEFPSDQREEDALALCFDGQPLNERVELLGRPVVHLNVASDRPWAFVMARLCAVSPDGVSTLLTRGALNLTHRRSHAEPSPLNPGKMVHVRFELDLLGQAVEAGSRLRLALSPTYWPWIWPSPERVTLTVGTGAESWVELPVRSAPQIELSPTAFGTAEQTPSLSVETRNDEPPYRRVFEDVGTGEQVVERNELGDERVKLLPDGPGARNRFADRWSVHEEDPLSARSEHHRLFSVTYGDIECEVQTHSTMTATATDFHVQDTLEAFENGNRVFVRSWSRAIPRDHV